MIIIEDLTDLLIFKAKLKIGMKFKLIEGHYIPLINDQIYEVINILECDKQCNEYSLCNRKKIEIKGNKCNIFI